MALVINGWTILAHPLFLDQLKVLVAAVEAAEKKNPDGFQGSREFKLLAAIRELAFRVIPSDPSDKKYEQGATLGPDYKHWRRAKFFQQYRLFFRYRSDVKLIIYAWVNDEDTTRAYDSKTDAYAVFRKMLNKGNPPDDWDTLKANSTETFGEIPSDPDKP